MGIESDQLVFDYLSRVGDLAQQQGLPAATRMRLVTRLRAEIDERKPDSVSGVKRMLARLGAPEAVVAEAGGAALPEEPSGGGATIRAGISSRAGQPSKAGQPSRAGDLSSRRTSPRDKLAGLAWRSGLTVGKALWHGNNAAASPASPATPASSASPATPASSSGLPPHLAGADELGDGDDAPDWWRTGPTPLGPGETVPGFVGGIEIPEIWERPDDENEGEGEGAGKAEGKGKSKGKAEEDAGAAAEDDTGDIGLGEEEEEPGSWEDSGGPMPLRAWLSPVPTLAAVLLVAGAVLGSWWAMAGGWALAYVSRRLTRTEAKFAALGVPGIFAGGLLVWLWGRVDRRWGEPVAEGRLGQELLDGLPVVARVAALASALFLLWRMRRAAR
ncbi:hypothetical protein ACFY12_29530 [Streptomyces sp. NPDC001339]|uniref:hypothetical protein n=1 Tax=Streptomyces sp. NPDC001339 TaxID=3364563 RepID=UPI003690BA3D